MTEQETDPEVLMHGHVMRTLRKDDLTAAEFEVCRKYLNDRASRSGYTTGFVSTPEAKNPKWDTLGFDDVAVAPNNDEGSGSPHAGDSDPR